MSVSPSRHSCSEHWTLSYYICPCTIILSVEVTPLYTKMALGIHDTYIPLSILSVMASSNGVRFPRRRRRGRKFRSRMQLLQIRQEKLRQRIVPYIHLVTKASMLLDEPGLFKFSIIDAFELVGVTPNCSYVVSGKLS